MKNYRQLKTGGDPRALADFAALRAELSKLTHPARPDVNWHYVEKLCLTLFTQNGIDLQTAAWYTLARTQLAGLLGLNEGIGIIEALLSRQWGIMWPQTVHARMEILTGLGLRLQQQIRILPIDYQDLSQLYHAEEQLIRLGEVLQRLELKHLSQIDTLRIYLHACAVRLENSEGEGSFVGDLHPTADLSLENIPSPETALNNHVGHSLAKPEIESVKPQWIYVPQPELTGEIPFGRHSVTRKGRLWVAAITTLLVIGCAALWGGYHQHRETPLEELLVESVTPLPRVLTASQLARLHRQRVLPPPLIDETQQRLTHLAQLTPDWNLIYGRQLVEQAETLWPNQAAILARQWQQQLDTLSLSPESLTAWQRGMAELDKLSNKLNELDDKKGKYITVSELKSVIFSATQAFNQGIPAEEQLRFLKQYPENQSLPPAKKAQLEMHLKQLIASYAELQHRPGDSEKTG